MYQRGEGVARDDVVAMKWFTKSAEQGDAVGEFDLGVVYWSGTGVPKDLAKAAYWFQLSANQGHTEAERATWLVLSRRHWSYEGSSSGPQSNALPDLGNQLM
jgi:hypothetical protein